MPIMDTVTGGVGTGIQPKDNPNPAAPPSSAANETLVNSTPPPSQQPMAAGGGQAPPPAAPTSPPPAASAAPAQGAPLEKDKEDDEVNALIGQLAGGKKPEAVQKKLNEDQDETQRLIDQLSGNVSDTEKPGQGAITRKPGESGWDAALRSLPESSKFIGAQMRAHLGRDPVEQRAAFESMYGTGNVKTAGGALYFRPEAGQKFRKVDEQLFNGMTDTILFNLLNAGPLAANIASQVGTDSMTGNMVAGGAMGGAADAITRQGMISGLNQISDRPQDHADIVKETMKEAGLNAVMPLGLKYAAKLPIAKQAMNKLASTLVAKGPEEKALAEAGEEVGKLSQVRTAFKEFKESIFPQAAPTPEKTGIAVGNAIDKVHETLSKSVGLIKDEALALAEQKGINAPMSHTMERVGNILQEHGYAINDLGEATAIGSGQWSHLPEPAGQSLVGEGRMGAVRRLADYYNRLNKESAASQGTQLKQVFSDIDNLTKFSAFDKATPINADVRNLYKSVRNAATQDRNSAINEIYKDSGLPNEKIWKDSFDKYSGNIDAISDFKAMFHSPQERELLVDAMSKSSSAEKNEMLDGMKQVLGQDSKEWNSFRGEVFSNILTKNTQNGVVNAGEIAKFLTKPGNQPFVTRMFSNEEKGTLNRMLLETQKINKGVGLSDDKKNVLKAGMDVLSHMSGKPIQFVKSMMGVLENNKEAVDYLVDEGFLEMAQKAEGPEAKRRILDAMRYADNLRSKMKIIDVPTTHERLNKEVLRRYAPVAGPALSNLIQEKTPATNIPYVPNVSQKFEPGKAPSNASPLPPQ